MHHHIHLVVGIGGREGAVVITVVAHKPPVAELVDTRTARDKHVVGVAWVYIYCIDVFKEAVAQLAVYIVLIDLPVAAVVDLDATRQMQVLAHGVASAHGVETAIVEAQTAEVVVLESATVQVFHHVE